MQRLKVNRAVLIGLIAVIGVVIALIETLVAANDAALLFTLVFWIALAQGTVALVAAAELSRAKWIQPLKRDLLSTYPVMLLLALLFLILGLKLEIYPWSGEPNVWLNQSFFIGRNFVLLILTALLAWKFGRESIRESANRKTYAVLYILCFVFTQSLVAFDWVMTLERPWFSTLFGGYFFVESFYAGIALAGLMGLSLLKNSDKETASLLRNSIRDAATLLFGFALFWAGLFFAQYLVIWYGNLPEETGFLVSRLAHPALRVLAPIILLALFVVPFVGLISERAKLQPRVVQFMSLLVLAGILLERIFFLAPVVPLNALLIVLEFAGIGLVFAATIINKRDLLPQ